MPSFFNDLKSQGASEEVKAKLRIRKPIKAVVVSICFFIIRNHFAAKIIINFRGLDYFTFDFCIWFFSFDFLALKTSNLEGIALDGQ